MKPVLARLFRTIAPTFLLFASIALSVGNGCSEEDKTCSGGNCVCNEKNCNDTCADGKCNYVCEGATSCIYSCPKGGCNVDCGSASECRVACPGNNCQVTCNKANVCQVSECKSGCSQVCGGSKDCSLSCGAVDSCSSDGASGDDNLGKAGSGGGSDCDPSNPMSCVP